MMKLATAVDEEWARELTAARVTLFDPHARVWIEDGRLEVQARRSDLTDRQLRMWADALAERLYGGAILSEPATEVDISNA
jgi:hypothetical protein